MSRFLWPLLLAAVATAEPRAAEAQSANRPTVATPPVAEGSVELVFLGTGFPRPDPLRQGPSFAVIVDGTSYLVDAGLGVVRQAAAACQQGIAALCPELLTTLFVTHLHSDHTLGLADLFFTPWFVGRKTPVEIYGPEGIAEMANHLLSAYQRDIAIRLHGGEGANPTGYEHTVHELPLPATPQVIFRRGALQVTAFAVRHGKWPEALGFRFDAHGRSIVYSGDTAPAESVVSACSGCDVLIHGVYTAVPPPPGRTAMEWARYLAAYQTEAGALGELATRARAKTLILTHVIGNPVDSLRKVRQHYAGTILVARDLDLVAP